MSTLFGGTTSTCSDSNMRERFTSKKITSSSAVVSTVVGIHLFKDLGLCDWICQSTLSMGFKKPTEIQAACIPAILSGRDVIGVAETGSGKTAAFALPILQLLSEDPYGIYCVVISPTRELAVQIGQQFEAFGTPIALKVCLVIGGVSIMEQGSKISKKPHILIGTPGRIRHHIEGADPPDLRKVRFLVLDEADRLLASGFHSELRIILSKMSVSRQTLLFSATMTTSLEEVRELTEKETLQYNFTHDRKLPKMLEQQYLFVPSNVKMCYLFALLTVLRKGHQDLAISNNTNLDQTALRQSKRKDNESGSKYLIANIATESLIIIFVSTCKRCEETKETLSQFNIDCVALHSMMTQNARTSALGKFKNQSCKILIATDVASRGLDIPSVDIVINFDIPKILSDYIHRVGRTARAGRDGRSVTFVTQHDVELVHDIERYTGVRMKKEMDVSEKDVVSCLNTVSKAMRIAQLRLMENGFEEKTAVLLKRKRTQRKNSIINVMKKNKAEAAILAHVEERGADGGHLN